MNATRTSVLLTLALLLLGSGLVKADEIARSRIKREPVSSSNVASIGYSQHLRALEVEFARGAIYRFLEVPPDVYRGLIAAESKGRFVAENIRGKYRFVRVRSRRASLATRTQTE